MQATKLIAALALVGVARGQSGCDSTIQLSTALNILKISQTLTATVKTLSADVAANKKGVASLNAAVKKLNLGRPRSLSLTYTIIAHHQNNGKDVTIAPRYPCPSGSYAGQSRCAGVSAVAAKETFNTAADYGDTYAGAKSWAASWPFEFAGHNRWYTEPFAENFRTARLSLYWSVSIGTRPHPSPKPYAHVGMLQNGNGGYHQWVGGGPSRNYNRARVLNGMQEMQNFKVYGQSWGTHNYDDLGAVYEYAPWGIDLRVDTFLMCNWGPERIVIKGMWGIVHGEVAYIRRGNKQYTISNWNNPSKTSSGAGQPGWGR